MVIELLLLIFIIWAVFAIVLNSPSSIRLRRLREIGYHIYRDSGHDDIFNIEESDEITHVVIKEGDISTIKIRLHNNGIYYNDDTIVAALVHEMAHIISPNPGHDKHFEDCENFLINSAIRLGYLDSEYLVEDDYPCRVDD